MHRIPPCRKTQKRGKGKIPSRGLLVVIRALPVIGFIHVLEAIRIGLHQRISGGVPERAVANCAVAIHVVVLDHCLIEDVVAEALTVAGIDVLLSPVAGVLGVVVGFDSVHASGGVCADLIDAADDSSAIGQHRLLLDFVVLLQLRNVGGSLRVGPLRNERKVYLKTGEDSACDRVYLAGIGIRGKCSIVMETVIAILLRGRCTQHPEHSLHALPLRFICPVACTQCDPWGAGACSA